MTLTEVGLVSERGAHTRGTATVVHTSARGRLLRALGLVAAGLLGGAMFLPIPGVHLLTTWALPLAGAVAGWSAWRGVVRLEGVQGPCPDCGEVVAWEGGRLRQPHWAACARCRRNVQVRLPSPPEAPAPGT